MFKLVKGETEVTLEEPQVAVEVARLTANMQSGDQFIVIRTDGWKPKLIENLEAVIETIPTSQEDISILEDKADDIDVTSEDMPKPEPKPKTRKTRGSR